ncbi:MAG: polysaccharide biosynthesis C-terminal domain-containing protein [Hydrogenoanaerobacterium sp.]
MKQVKAFFLNAVLLTATSLFMRTVGMGFGVYLAGKIGAAGLGLYQLIMSVYTLSVTLACSGISLAATRLVAEELGRDNETGAKKAMRRCLFYSAFFGTATGTMLFFCAEHIGLVWLCDRRTIASLRILALSMPFIGMSSAMNGYFTAVRRVFKSATSQILEQGLKIAFTIIGLTMLLPRGLEYACFAIVGGGALAEACSFCYSLLLFLHDSRRYRTSRAKQPGLSKRLFGISLPVAFSAYARSGLLTIEHMLIPRGLKKYGASSESALASYGLLQGMVLPVVLFPSAVLQSLAGLLVPELAECRAQCRYVRINYIVGRIFKLSLLFSIGVAGIMACFADEIALAVYKNTSAASYIRILSPLIPVMYLDTAVDGMLKGLGEQLSSMRYNIFDAACSVILVYLLIPHMGIKGYICTIFFTELLNSALSASRLIAVTQFKINLRDCLFKPIFAVMLSAFTVHLLFYNIYFKCVAVTILKIFIAACVYLIYLVLCRSISTDDVKWGISILK